MTSNMHYKNIDEYISFFSGDTKRKLEYLRSEIKKIVPEANEVIAYNMPAFKTSKVLIYFAAYKNHIGIYPASKAIDKFKNELGNYKTSKGAIQIPLAEELPIKLIKEIIMYNKNEYK